MIAPQRLKIPPISAVAASVSESWVWKRDRARDADLRGEQAAGDPGHERGEPNAQSL